MSAYTCEDCGKTYNNLHNLGGIDDVEDRVSPGELMAAGQCECGSLIAVTDEDVPNYTLEACARIMRARGWTVVPA